MISVCIIMDAPTQKLTGWKGWRGHVHTTLLNLINGLFKAILFNCKFNESTFNA